MFRWAIWLVSCLIVCTGCKQSATPGKPLEFSLWYWHRPYAPAASDIQDLQKLGMNRIFVRAATLSFDEGHLIVVQPQDVSGPAPNIETHLVINLEGSVVASLDQVPTAELAHKLSEVYEVQKAALCKVGATVAGMQVDFDCPTSRLAYYRELLSELRPLIGKDLLSITALPTWLGAQAFRRVAQETDFFVPQFYEGRIGRSLADAGPISDVAEIRHGVPLAESVGVPYWVGIAAYGHAAFYDARGQLQGTYKDLSPAEALRHPNLVLEDAYPSTPQLKRARSEQEWNGEQILRFRAVQADQSGRGLGSVILYKIPTASLIERQLQAVREMRGENCQGVIIFRYPEEAEAMTVPLKSLEAVMRGAAAEPKIELNHTVNPSPFDLIERPGEGRLPSDLALGISNRGTEGLVMEPDSLVVRIRFDRPGFTYKTGDIDAYELTDASGLRASPLRATQILIRRSSLAAGEAATLGKVAIHRDGPTTVAFDVDYRWAGGFRHGNLNEAPQPIADMLVKDRR